MEGTETGLLLFVGRMTARAKFEFYKLCELRDGFSVVRHEPRGAGADDA